MIAKSPTGEYVLRHHNDNDAVEGETVTSYRHKRYVLKGGTPPHNENSAGRVSLVDDEGFEHEYFPGVVSMKWIKL